MILFGKKNRGEDQSSIEELKFQEKLRNEKKDREKENSRENWHQNSKIEKKDSGKKIMNMIRAENGPKIENVYEKASRMLKNEKRRQKIIERKREIKELEKKKREETRKFMQELRKRSLSEREINKRKDAARSFLRKIQERRENKMRKENITEGIRKTEVRRRRLVCELKINGATKTCFTHRVQITLC